MFNRKTKKVLQIAFAVVSVLMIVSMILLYFPALYR
jgi:hypothetical protein